MASQNHGVSRAVATAVAFTLALDAGAQSIRYHAQPLTVPSGFRVRAMNSSRTLVGEFPMGRYSQAAVWSGGVLTPLGALGGRSAALRDINDAGVAVGTVYTSAFDDLAVIWSGGELVPLDLADEGESFANKINSSGQVAGTVGYSAVARWDAPDAPPVVLATGSESGGQGINDRGDVIGATGLGPRVWSADGSFRDLEPHPIESYHLRINNGGLVSGLAGIGVILFWNTDGELTEVSTGWGDVNVLSPDSAGRVVWSGMNQDLGEYQARLWENGVEFALNDLVDGFDGQVRTVKAMNSLGEILVSTTNGYQVLVPIPAPASAAPVIFGLTLAYRRRR